VLNGHIHLYRNRNETIKNVSLLFNGISEIYHDLEIPWSILFGAMMNALKIETRIVHDFLDHCWNEAMIKGEWVHMDSTLAYPISVNHPYYEQNWGIK